MIKNDDKLKLKSDGLKLISNTPIYNDERYGSYAEIIDEKVKEAGVYNIGIIAPYGAGKSSLIKTYKEKYGVKKSVTISLANFSSVDQGEEKSKNANNNVKDIERGQVEKSILEQLLFSVRKCDVPESKINRINPFRTFEGFVTAFSLVACLVFICLSVLDLKNILPHSTEKLFYCFFALSAFFLIIFIFFAFKFYSVKRIAIKDIETEFGSNQESILNKFIDEIIYYFFSTKTTVVFIEDLDRFDDTNIFAKLREINFLVNNSSVVKEKVTFIYAIKDDIFQTETERAKFFDFVISLLPLVNPINAKDKLNELVNFKDSQIRLPEDYISDISYFISEMRVLKNIVNDYISYYKRLNFNDTFSETKNKKLFSLMVYKNLFPRDFAVLQFGKGKLNQYFLNKEEKVREKIDENKQKIKEIENLLNAADEEGITEFKYLKYIVAGIILENGVNGYSGGVPVYDLTSFVDQRNFCIRIDSNYRTKAMAGDSIDAILGKKLTDIEENIKNKTAERRNELIAKRKSIVEENRKLINISLDEYMKKYNDLSVTNETVKFLLSNGYIAEDYMDYIVESGQEIISNNDKLFIRSVLAKNESSYECRIDKPEIVIKQIKETLFSDRYILNYDIVSNLLSATKSQLLPKKERLIEYLCSGDDRSLDFVIKYVNESNKDIKVFCENVIIKSQMLFKSIIESSVIPSDKKIDVLLYLMEQLTDVDLPRFNENSCIINYLNGLDNPVQEFASVDIQTFARVLHVFSVKLKNIVVKSDYYKFAEKAIEYNAYQVSLSNVSFILFNILKFDRIKYGKKILTAIMNIADDNIKRYILSNDVRFINEIIKNADEICDSEETIKYLLTRNDVDSDTKKAYIHKLTVRFDVFAEINNELCLEAIKSDKIKYSWSNASFCIDNLKIEIAELCDYFVSGAEELSEQECRDENLILNLCNEIGCPTTIKKLAKSFMVNFAVNQINDDDVAVVLIEEGIIEPNSDNLEICCDSERINPACAILCDHKELLPELNRYSLKNDFIDKIVTSKYGDTLIVDLISSLNNYKPASVEAKQKIKEAIIKNNIHNVNCELIDYLIESEISEDDKYKLVHLQAAGSSYSKCMQWFKEIDENNSAFEMEEGGSLKKKKEDISGSKVLRILSENGFCKVEEMVRYIKIKRIK